MSYMVLWFPQHLGLPVWKSQAKRKATGRADLLLVGASILATLCMVRGADRWN